MCFYVFVSSRRRHTRCALVTGVQTCALPICQPDGKPRGKAEIAQIEQLVKAAVGYDASRSDQVTVISRSFAGAAELDAGQPWYEAGWLPMVARNVTAILIALLVLILGVQIGRAHV